MSVLTIRALFKFG